VSRNLSTSPKEQQKSPRLDRASQQTRSADGNVCGIGLGAEDFLAHGGFILPAQLTVSKLKTAC